ncbi:MAG: hypothetical protein HYS83_01825 [Candidatus Blackburnbacteria bacterium]|nr:hypothetical protein [Candidatus Blackburnbacteria bacterium]
MKPRILSQETQIKTPFFLGFASIAIALFLLLIFWKKLPSQVPLFYSKPWGEEQLVSPVFFLIPLVLSGGFLLVNTFLASVLPENAFLKRSLVLAAAISSVLASIAVIRVLFLIS